MKRLFLPLVTHISAAFIGFAAGIYLLPILTEPEGPSASEMQKATNQALYRGEFKRDLAGSDFLHWGEGTVSIGREYISLDGSLAPGPDYRLYLSPAFVQTEAEVEAIKSDMVQVGEVKTFSDFVIPVPSSIDPSNYKAVVIWCEAFEEFITAATYR